MLIDLIDEKCYLSQQTYHHSPNQDLMSSSGLPPMSSFRGGQPSSVPSSTPGYSAPSPTVNGADMRPPTSATQTGIAVGKALQSVSCLTAYFYLFKSAL